MNEKPRRFEPRQLILHIPHSSTVIPVKYRKLFYLDEKQLQEERLRMTDLYTDELFDLPGIPEENRLIFPFSRLICDVERFRDERLEIMAERGMGICYQATSGLQPLKRVTAKHREEMLKLYDDHHAALTAAADRVIHACGAGLLIDCHSFSSRQLPYEAVGAEGSAGRQRPDICIGTDPDFHTPRWLQDVLARGFAGRGYSVAVNEPFSGSLVPMKHYHQDRRLFSVRSRSTGDGI